LPPFIQLTHLHKKEEQTATLSKKKTILFVEETDEDVSNRFCTQEDMDEDAEMHRDPETKRMGDTQKKENFHNLSSKRKRRR